MRANGTNCLHFFLLFVLLQVAYTSEAQSTQLDPQKWSDELSKQDYHANEKTGELGSILANADSAQAFQFLNQLLENGKSKGDHFLARFNCIKARTLFFKNSPYKFDQPKYPGNLDPIRETVRDLFSSAMDIAYRSEDDYLVAFVSYNYAITILRFGEVGVSVMYAKNSVDVYEKLSYEIPPGQYQFLAEMLYTVKEYDDCIKYGKKAVAAWQKSSKQDALKFAVNCMNTVALGYHRLKRYDSAFLYYNKAQQLAGRVNDTTWSAVWNGIISGNMGQILYEQGKYDTAHALLKKDYVTSKKAGYYDNAGNSLQWAARADLALGNKMAALSEMREAFVLLKLWPDAGYLRNSYFTATEIFKVLNNFDSAFYYNNLYAEINDSLDKVVAANSFAISKARLNDETSKYNILRLNREKTSQLLLRNFIIAFIFFAAILALLYVNRLRVRQKHKQQLALQEKQAAATMAREQLQLVTQNLLEKTGLVEELQRQLDTRTVSAERQELATTISNLTILTEADWEKFKSLFGQLYPGFFLNLSEKVADITDAELRMAALTRLRLSTPQIASILGISTNSVYKTRQRLRQRLNLSAESNMEELLAGL